MSNPNPEKIAALNAALRTRFEGGQVYVTAAVEASPCRKQIVEAVRNYDFAKADPGNDRIPRGTLEF